MKPLKELIEFDEVTSAMWFEDFIRNHPRKDFTSDEARYLHSWWREGAKFGFKVGVDRTLLELSKSAGEFDEGNRELYKFAQDLIEEEGDEGFVSDVFAGARWQFEQDKMIIASLRLRIAELEGEK